MVPWIVFGILVLAAASASADEPRASGGGVRTKIKAIPPTRQARELAAKWGGIFGVPTPVMLAIMRIESGFRPHLKNLRGADLARGGAWGMMQQTLMTAKGNIDRLRKSGNSQVKKTLQKWDGKPETLLDPDFNVMLGAFQLARNYKRFGNWRNATEAYQQGAGRVAQGKTSERGRAYGQKALYLTKAYT